MSRPEGGRGDVVAERPGRGVDDVAVGDPGWRAADRRRMRNILLILGKYGWLLSTFTVRPCRS
jgi:hypothetical protein